MMTINRLEKQKLSQDAKILLAIEYLLRTSGRRSWNVVSVVQEANKYCYKTVDGTIGTVRQDFLDERISDNIF